MLGAPSGYRFVFFCAFLVFFSVLTSRHRCVGRSQWECLDRQFTSPSGQKTRGGPPSPLSPMLLSPRLDFHSVANELHKGVWEIQQIFFLLFPFPRYTAFRINIHAPIMGTYHMGQGGGEKMGAGNSTQLTPSPMGLFLCAR